VRLGLKRNQRELSDVWPPLMAPPNVAALEGVKAFGVDVMGGHRGDFPPAYLERIDAGQNLSAMGVARDRVIRSEVFDAIQVVLATHEILVSPTLAAMPVDNASNGDTQDPTHVDGIQVDPLIGLAPHLSHELQRPSDDLHSGGPERPPAGRHAAHRPPLRRRRRARRRRGRANAPVGRLLSHLRAAAAFAVLFAQFAATRVRGERLRPESERQ